MVWHLYALGLHALQTSHSARHWPLWMVGGPAHGPGVDVVQLAAAARPSVLITLPEPKELTLAIPEESGNGPVVPGRQEARKQEALPRRGIGAM